MDNIWFYHIAMPCQPANAEENAIENAIEAIYSVRER
jgi:hypothetical protein